MKRFSTHCMNKNDENNDQRLEKSKPRKQTLDFLKQFARVYCHESGVQTDLSGLIVN